LLIVIGLTPSCADSARVDGNSSPGPSTPLAT
jgi:hypothetical protein